MKLSEYKGEDALELLADILEPTAMILKDQSIWELAKKSRPIDSVTYVLREYKKEIIQILAAMDRTPVEEFECDILTLPIRIFDILNDEDLKTFFNSQLQNAAGEYFGAVTDNTPAAENE